ncbi:MAG: nicotinamide mononucleotide transporter [Candidatus Nanoarchaeia archaeon]
MIEAIVYGFSQYYGLDYLSFIFGIIGTILLTKKNELGFIMSAISVTFASVVSVIAGQYGFILANTVTFALLISGFFAWRRESVESIFQSNLNSTSNMNTTPISQDE